MLKVCTNGIICIGGFITWYSPQPFPLNVATMTVLAPFWADINPRNGGYVWSRVTSETRLLSSVSSLG